MVTAMEVLVELATQRATSFLIPLQGLDATGCSGSLMFLRGHHNEQKLVPSWEVTDGGDCHDQGLLFRSGQFFSSAPSVSRVLFLLYLLGNSCRC